MNILLAIVGGLFRRWWGGWGDTRHIFDMLMVLGLGFASGVLHTGTILASILYGVVVLLAFLNTFHGEGMRQGFKYALIMGVTYGLYTTCLAGIIWYSTGTVSYWTLVSGFLTPVAYQLAWKYKDSIPKITVFGKDFISEPTTVGEVFLGALVLS